MAARATLIAATLLTLAATASAQTMPGHPGMGASPGETPATQGYKSAHMSMMKSMQVPYTGDPDVDFRLQMIPHHEGAIDMAKVAIRYAKDPSTKKLAEDILAAQEREVAEMRSWLKAHGR